MAHPLLPLMLGLIPQVQGPPPAVTPPAPPKTLVKTVRKGGRPKSSVDLVFVGDGYQKDDEAKFWKDVDRYSKRFLKREPFVWYAKRFNIHGIFVPSQDEGCDLSLARNRKATLLESYFDRPDGRLLRFRNGRKLKELVEQVPSVDIAFVMVNVKKYGGSGAKLYSVRVRGRPLPAPTFAAHTSKSFLIAIHELGHSFANLADEYVDPGMVNRYRLPRRGRDFSQPNVTLPGKFDQSSFDKLKASVKWKDFLSLPGADEFPWLHEGGYFRQTGVFRPWPNCTMRSSRHRFCPVCMQAMSKAIVKACGDTWDEKAYHKKRPLKLWKK